MPLDRAKMDAMRGGPATVDEDAPGGDEPPGPSESRLSAARRFCAAVEAKDYRAMIAAFDDMDDDEGQEY